jgi:hypothetical protein
MLNLQIAFDPLHDFGLNNGPVSGGRAGLGAELYARQHNSLGVHQVSD